MKDIQILKFRNIREVPLPRTLDYKPLHNMKLILIIILLLPTLAFSQPKPKRFDNTITVNQFVSLNKLKSVLFDNNITIKNSDTSFIETSESKLKGDGIVDIKFLIKRTDSNLVIKGQYRINVALTFGGTTTQPSFNTIEYWRDKDSRPRQSFDIMDRIALSLSPNVTYSKN